MHGRGGCLPAPPGMPSLIPRVRNSLPCRFGCVAVLQRAGVYSLLALRADLDRRFCRSASARRGSIRLHGSRPPSLPCATRISPRASRKVFLAALPSQDRLEVRCSVVMCSASLAGRIDLARARIGGGAFARGVGLRPLCRARIGRGAGLRLSLHPGLPLVRSPCSQFRRMDPPTALPAFRQPRIPRRRSASPRATPPRKSFLTRSGSFPRSHAGHGALQRRDGKGEGGHCRRERLLG